VNQLTLMGTEGARSACKWADAAEPQHETTEGVAKTFLRDRSANSLDRASVLSQIQ
jgi:hypothetical protein